MSETIEPGLSAEEIDAQDAQQLPAREQMSAIDPSLLGTPHHIVSGAGDTLPVEQPE